MANDLVVGLGFAVVLVLVASVLGTVERRERFAFVPGVVLVVLGLTFLSGPAAGAVALVGLAAVLASTVPMLLE